MDRKRQISKDYKSMSFEDYKAQFEGTDEGAFELWICFEVSLESDSEGLKQRIKEVRDRYGFI